MAMSATLAVPSNIIANRPVVAMLTLSNTGGSDVTVTSVQAVVTPSTGTSIAQSPSMVAEPPTFPIGRTSTVSASGTLNVPLELIFLRPQGPGNPANRPGSTCLLDAVIQVSDGTVFSVALPQWVAVSPGAPQESEGFGQFRFDDGRQLINIVLL